MVCTALTGSSLPASGIPAQLLACIFTHYTPAAGAFQFLGHIKHSPFVESLPMMCLLLWTLVALLVPYLLEKSQLYGEAFLDNPRLDMVSSSFLTMAAFLFLSEHLPQFVNDLSSLPSVSLIRLWALERRKSYVLLLTLSWCHWTRQMLMMTELNKWTMNKGIIADQ